MWATAGKGTLLLLGLHRPHVEGCATTADLAPGRGLRLPGLCALGLWNGLLLVSPNSPTFSGQARVLGEGVCMCLPVTTTHWWYFHSSYLLIPSGFSALPHGRRPSELQEWGR